MCKVYDFYSNNDGYSEQQAIREHKRIEQMEQQYRTEPVAAFRIVNEQKEQIITTAYGLDAMNTLLVLSGGVVWQREQPIYEPDDLPF